jgi:bacterial/archaeal transporter family-2 protein
MAALAVALAALAGLGGAVQVAVMGRLGERVGVFPAVAFSTMVSIVVAFAALLLVRRSVTGVGDVLHQPRWLWIGGLLSVFIVFTMTFAAPRIGTAATIGTVIAGNLVMGAAIDRYGLFGLDRIPLNWARVLGLAFLAAGAGLSLHRG